MVIHDGDGLEFEADDEAELQEIVRDGFRAPVVDSDSISLLVGDKQYKVFNIAARGVGIFLDVYDELIPEQLLADMLISFNGREFRVSGRVVHVSMDEAHVLCGIALTCLDEVCEQELDGYLQQCKRALFS